MLNYLVYGIFNNIQICLKQHLFSEINKKHLYMFQLRKIAFAIYLMKMIKYMSDHIVHYQRKIGLPGEQ